MAPACLAQATTFPPLIALGAISRVFGAEMLQIHAIRELTAWICNKAPDGT